MKINHLLFCNKIRLVLHYKLPTINELKYKAEYEETQE